MPDTTLHHSAKLHAPKPLVVRGGLRRTFGSLAGFTALALLSLGVYLLADSFAHPVDAEGAAVIVAAFVIALALLLLFFLFSHRKIPMTFPDQALGHSASSGVNVPSGEKGAKAPRNALRVDLPYQRAYVDRSRIRR